MSVLTLSPLHRFGPFAPLVLRLGLGLVFVAHGYQKINDGVGGFDEMLTGLSVPAPALFAWLVALAELVGGVLLLLGLLTRLATIPLIGTLIGAILLVKLDVGIIAGPDSPMPGAELDIALLVGLVALLIIGGGPYALDRMLGLESVRDRETVSA